MDGLDLRDIFGVAPLQHKSDLKDNNVICANDLFAKFPRFAGYKIYSTKAHAGMYNILLAQAINLQNGNYVNRQGESSSTMVGAKGIGKTTSLKTFAHICRDIVPGIYVMYVSFSNIMSNEWLTSKSIVLIIIELFKDMEVDIEVPENSRSSCEALVRYMKMSGIKLMLLVDELDQLYKVKEQVCLATLHDLSYFGNQPTGTMSTIVCGSSSMMEFLITANANANLRMEFPLLDMGAPNLNETKFLTKRVYSNAPTDLSAVATLTEFELNDKTVPWFRLIAFAACVSSRAVGRMLNDSSIVDDILSSLSPHAALSGSNTLSNSDLSHLRQKIIAKVFKKNKSMFNSLLNSSDIVVKIATINWEDQFVPLKYDEVKSLWNKLVTNGLVSVDRANALDDYLLHLGDRAWLTIGCITNSHPEDIYPYSMYHCVKEQIASSIMPTFIDSMVDSIKLGCIGFGKRLADPKVLAAAPALICNIS